MGMISRYVAALAVSCFLVACGNGSGSESSRPVVTVSIPPQAWLLEAIAGDSVDVNVLLSAGSNPETFEPGVGMMKQAALSDVLMLSGDLGFERQLAGRLTDGNRDMLVVDTSRGIEPIYGTHSHHGHAHEGEVADPHTWTSVRNARVIAANMLEALVAVDSARAGFYRSRAALLDARLDSIDRAVTARLDSLDSRSFMVWHPSLSYFARDYDLQQLSVGNEGKETTVQGLRAVMQQAREHGARVLFIQADFDTRQAEPLSREIGAEVVSINPLDRDWEHQINIITDALDQH